MAETNGNSGLCMTCNNAPSCFHRNRRGPVQFCETFDDYVPPVVRSGDLVTTATAEPATVVGAPKEDVPGDTGLCMNCRHRRTCKHPRRDVSVWHCEDYE